MEELYLDYSMRRVRYLRYVSDDEPLNVYLPFGQRYRIAMDIYEYIISTFLSFHLVFSYYFFSLTEPAKKPPKIAPSVVPPTTISCSPVLSPKSFCSGSSAPEMTITQFCWLPFVDISLPIYLLCHSRIESRLCRQTQREDTQMSSEPLDSPKALFHC